MATYYPAHSAMNWSDAKWSLADDDAQNAGPPGAGDGFIFTSNSGDVTLTASPGVAFGVGYMTGYTGTLDLGPYTLDIDAAVMLDGTITGSGTISVTGNCEVKFGTDLSGWTGKLLVDGADAQSLKTNGVSMPAIEINKGGGTCTAQDAVTVHDADGFLLAAGTYDDGGNAHNIAGSIRRTGGTLTTAATWTMTADGTLQQNNHYGSAFYDLNVANGVTATNDSAIVYVKKLSGGGTITGTASIAFSTNARSNWLAGWSGTLSIMVLLINCNKAPGGDITVANKDLRIYSTSSHTIALAGVNIGTGDLLIYGDGAGDSMIQTALGP